MPPWTLVLTFLCAVPIHRAPERLPEQGSEAMWLGPALCRCRQPALPLARWAQVDASSPFSAGPSPPAGQRVCGWPWGPKEEPGPGETFKLW